MGATVLGFAGSADFNNISATRYMMIGACHASGVSGFTTEADAQLKIRAAGKLSRLSIRVKTNGRSTNSTVTTRKNAAAGAGSITITASTTGIFEDTSFTDTVAADDLINLRHVTGSGTGSQVITHGLMRFIPTSGTVAPLCYSFRNTGGLGFSTASTTVYAGMHGSHAANTQPTTEARLQVKTKVTQVISHARVYVLSNTRTTNGSVKFRKNGADGNLNVTITASTAGQFEDTSNSDSPAVDDLINWSITTGTGTGTTTILQIAAKFSSNSTDFEIGAMNYPAAGNMTANVANYLPILGELTPSTTETDYRVNFPMQVRASFLRVRVSTNGASNAVSVALRQNGSSSALATTVSASTTGLFEDTTNSVVIAQNDDINILYDSPNSSNVIVDSVTLRLNTSINGNVGNPGTWFGQGVLPGN